MLKGSVFPLDKHKGGMDDVEEEDDGDDDSDTSDRWSGQPSGWELYRKKKEKTQI